MSDILSEITAYMKYCKFVEKENRRETWSELITRNMYMNIFKFPHLKDEIIKQYSFIFNKKVLPSMRSLQLGGKAIFKHNQRIYNCCYCPIQDIEVFGEIFFLLLCGCGCGFSVQKQHIAKLPKINKSNNFKQFVIDDSIEGWADSVKILLYGCLCDDEVNNNIMPLFDYSEIRQQGKRLKTTGGFAPGSSVLRDSLDNIREILYNKKDGERLTSLECHDIVCHIGEAVFTGGIRRSACISLFSKDDDLMINCKSGEDWFIKNKQRCRANNSMILLRSELKEEEFKILMNTIEKNKTGEPGLYLTNDLELGTNPCVEISLRAYQFCNLTEINCSNLESQEDLNKRCQCASFIGTLQATYTDFTYLRPIWKQTTEEDALLGVSLTGIATITQNFDFVEASKIVVETNKKWANILKINPAKRCTCIKPAGTTSLIFGCSSGIHPYYSNYYIRRLRIGKNEQIYNYLIKNVPELLEDDCLYPHLNSVLSIPIKSPERCILKSEPVLNFLESIKKFYVEWVLPGHISGVNTHNISATVIINESDNFNDVSKWMWSNKNFYNGLSLLFSDNNVYKQTPFEDCTKETYEEMIKYTSKIDVTQIKENYFKDDTVLDVACGGGSCELTHL